jgi:Tol biopolymer transport system component
MIGTTVSHYKIVAKLGVGGMGEVYRATDSKLRRDVAIKVLPAAFVADPERLARFEREAQLLAQLHHPHIASIFGLEESGGVRALVMELVEGPTLQETLGEGGLPLEQAVAIARQIADALEAAHEKGIVHRDLKPANVKVTADGNVKVLDFGLAKALDPGAVSSSPTASPALMHSPTLTSAGTQLGVILGTAAYMAPEQARGVAVDKRADIWAFGVVLHEMLTGRRLFEGELVTDVLADVLRKPIDSATLPPTTPPAIRQLVRRCLERNPKNRLHDIADARIVLEDVIGGRAEDGPGVAGTTIAASGATTPRRGGAAIGFAAGALVVLAAALAWRSFAPRPRPLLTRFAISSASGASIYGGAGNSAISPDGRRVVFVGVDANGRQGLFIQELDRIAARLLPGTDGAAYPFWAPDSQRVAFFAQGKLSRVSLVDGQVAEIAPASEGRGGSWGREGTIVFAPSFAGALAAVSEAGGAARPVTRIEIPEQENSHRFPSFLPDGKRFIYIADPGANKEEGRVYLASLDGGERQLLYRTRRAPIYAEPGWLIDAIDQRLVARRFDAATGKISGEPVQLEEATPTYVNTQDRVASASDSGALLVPSAVSPGTKILWLDRRGRRLGEVPLPKGRFSDPRLSPDGRRLALMAQSSSSGDDYDVWVVDLETEQANRLTFTPTADGMPIWSPDGRSLVFQTNRRGPRDLWIRPASAGGVERALFESSTPWKVASSWVGDWLAFVNTDVETGFDIWLMNSGNPGEAPVALVRTPASESDAAISPDGRWLAFDSNEGGREEVYVVSLPDARIKYQVTTDGGGYPRWTRAGRELVYLRHGGSIAAVAVTPGDELGFGTPVNLFLKPLTNWSAGGEGFELDVAPDGERFVMLEPDSDGSQSLVVVSDWLSELGAGAGGGR